MKVLVETDGLVSTTRMRGGIASNVPEYRVLEIEGVTILTASGALDAKEPNIL